MPGLRYLMLIELAPTQPPGGQPVDRYGYYPYPGPTATGPAAPASAISASLVREQ
ncbi:MAG TPA: hypothetical protein VLM11_16400 [Streptosporangiaceae bacterium]|nr:hypothetical protein [Streptosporangiaceae bacterium]